MLAQSLVSTLTLASALSLLSVALAQDTHPSYELHDTARDLAQSLSFPIADHDDHAYDAHGASEASSDHVTLSTDVANSQGGVWAIEPNAHPSWLFELGFAFPLWPKDASQVAFGAGLGIWYSKERPLEEGLDKAKSSFLGWRTHFQGLGFSVTPTDSSSGTSEGEHDTLISAHYNDGTQNYAEGVDLLVKGIGHCFRDLHDHVQGEDVTYFRIVYHKATSNLTVEVTGPQKVAPVGSRRLFRPCFSVHSAATEPGGYFGVTSWTGTDRHGASGLVSASLVSIDVYAVDATSKSSSAATHEDMEEKTAPIASKVHGESNLAEADRHLHHSSDAESAPSHDHRAQHGQVSETLEDLRASQEHIVQAVSELSTKVDQSLSSNTQQDLFSDLKAVIQRLDSKLSLLEQRTEALAPLVQPDSPHLSKMTSDLTNLMSQLGQLREGIDQGHHATLSSHSTVLEQVREGLEGMSKKSPGILSWVLWLCLIQVLMLAVYGLMIRRMEARRKKYL